MSENHYKYDVFLSHSSKDKGFVRHLDKMLRSVGVRTFFDENDIPWGGNIPYEIEQGLEESRHLIFVLSPDSVGSEWADLERCITIFRSPSGRKGSVLPLLRRDCDGEKIPAALRILRHLYVRDDAEFQDAWPQIVSHLVPENRVPYRRLGLSLEGPPIGSPRKSVATICPLFGASKVYYTDLLSAIWRQCVTQGYELLVVPLMDPYRKNRLITHFSQLPTVSGVILITCQVEGSSWLEECHALNLPVVLIHDNIPQDKAKGYSVVSYIRPRLDALTELVNILVQERKAKNFSLVMVSPQNHAIRKEKLSIVENALMAHGQALDACRQIFTINEYSYEAGIDVVDRIIEKNPSTDAIVSLADVTAVGILRRLVQVGLSNKILVTGFDNVDIAVHNGLTTIDQQLEATGEQALNDLHGAIEAETFDEFRIGTYIPTTVRRRSSA